MPVSKDKREGTTVRISESLLDLVESEIRKHRRPRPTRGELLEQAWHIAHPPASIANSGDPAIPKLGQQDQTYIPASGAGVESPHSGTAESTGADEERPAVEVEPENPRLRELESTIGRIEDAVRGATGAIEQLRQEFERLRKSARAGRDRKPEETGGD